MKKKKKRHSVYKIVPYLLISSSLFLTTKGVDESQLEEMVKKLPKDMDLSALYDQVKDQTAFNVDQVKNIMKNMGIEGNHLWSN
jgi:hypothetical protein